MADVDIRRYQVPTHLRITDKLTIGFFSFTLRQLAVLLFGGFLALEVGHGFPVATLSLSVGATLANWLKMGCVLLLVALTLALALVRIRGRTLETWCFAWLRYRTLPRVYRWRRVPDPLFRAAASLPPVPGAPDAGEA